MAFKITARTILHLGSELISSDAVALYELIKNAVDAKSKNGVDVEYQISILAADYESFLLQSKKFTDVEKSVALLISKLRADAPKELTDQFRSLLGKPSSITELIDRAGKAYKICNKIVITDTGHGMSKADLDNIYLTIGTTHRADAIKLALEEGKEEPPYLGEKGVGRLAVMRLGSQVLVETATQKDSFMNLLEIDWNEFEKAYDQPLASVPIEPRTGKVKSEGFISGTRIIVSGLRASWTKKNLSDIATNQISRMTDPFSWAEKRRFQIRISYNGVSVDHTRVIVKALLDNAHAVCIGEYKFTDKGIILTATFTSSLYNGEATHQEFDITDLASMSGLGESGQSSPVVPILESLGPFRFEFYWFNRQRLKAYAGIGDREVVRGLVKAWSGICLFRDGYRVLPYGDEGDDWLGLDLEALGASGYKLNTKQLIGRVQIGRMTNKELKDQTNRQGLVDRPEKIVLVNLLREVVSDRWHKYLNDVGRALKAKEVVDFDPHQASSQVEELEQRARITVRSIRADFNGDKELLQQVMDAFKEIKDAHSRAVDRINTIEEEKERLTQLAGVGLMIEVIAHELTRATEITEVTIKGIDSKHINQETAAAFKVLQEQIKVIQRRLRILEPLSVTARQRRSHKNIIEIVDYVLDSHRAQFERHGIESKVNFHKKSTVSAFIIEGHAVQVLENLIVNSVYWLDLQKREFKQFQPQIHIEVFDSPPRIQVTDNGPGIPKGRGQSVFEPFYSTKPSTKSRRQGLGLYIARQNAELLGGSLELISEGKVHGGRFNTFELELRSEM